MITWQHVFDECYPEAGANAAELLRLETALFRPVDRAEIGWIVATQSNPFHSTDPEFSSWQPSDPAGWRIPTGKLPSAHVDFLTWSNGGEFRTGNRLFQFLATAGTFGIRECLLAYHVPEYMPDAMPFAFNGGGALYLFDMRADPIDGEYPIVCSHAGNLGWEPDEHVRIATSFVAACRGVVDVDDLFNASG